MLMPSAEVRLRFVAALIDSCLVGCGGAEPAEPIKFEPGKTRAALSTGPAAKKG